MALSPLSGHIRAGIENFRWHDLRHTWASWLAQQGAPMNVLQELGGWEPEEMVRRYAHLSKPQLLEHAELASNVFISTNLAQSIFAIFDPPARENPVACIALLRLMPREVLISIGFNSSPLGAGSSILYPHFCG